MKTAAIILMLVTGWFASPPAQADDGAARAAVDRLLGHLGGPDVWARARGAYIYEVHVSRWARLPYTHQVWIDFDAPRVLVRVENQDLRQLRSMNGAGDGWWIQEGTIAPYAPDFLADEYQRWQASAYRLFHLAAIGDDRLSYRMTAEDTLEFVYEGTAVLWLSLDDEGRPAAYRRFNNDFQSETVLGPLEPYGDVTLWKLVRTPDSSLVSHNLQFSLLPDGPQISFDPPEDLNNIER